MGWTFYQKPYDPKADLDRGLTWENESGKRRVLASAMTLTNYYAAVEHTKPDGTREVWAATYLIRFTRDGEFGYKDMTEHMGPYGCNTCPENILKLLTPLPPPDPEKEYDGNRHAQEWRDANWARINKRKQARKINDGDRLRFAEPMRFGSYGEFDTFRVQKRGRKTTFIPEGGFFTARITRWRDRQFEVLS